MFDNMGNSTPVNTGKTNEPQLTRKAVLFARVSTARQEKEGLSLDEIQLPRMRDYAIEQNLKIVREYAIGETGGSYKERKRFNEMIQFLKDNPDVTDIIAFRVDRITRNFRDAVTIEDLRIKYGKRIHCVDERLILSENSRATDLTSWNVKVFVGQEYLNRIKEDGLNTKINKLSRGELPWSAPYGYEFRTISVRPKVKNVVPVEPAASIVKEVFLLFSTGTYSCRTLARLMNKKYGTKFSQGIIHKFLRCEFYVGFIIDKKGGKKYPHNYEKIIDRELFDMVNQILDKRNLKGDDQVPKYGGIDSAYRGLIRCEECGCTITPEFKKRKLRHGGYNYHKYYHCTNRRGAHKSLKSYTESYLDEQVKEFLRGLKLTEEELDRVRKALAEAHAGKIDFYREQRRSLSQKRKKLEARQQEAYDMLMDKSITLELYNQNNERYRNELAEIQAQEAALDRADDNFYTNAGYILKVFKYADKLFDVATTAEKRDLIGLVTCSNRTLGPSGLILQGSGPFARNLLDSKTKNGWG